MFSREAQEKKKRGKTTKSKNWVNFFIFNIVKGTNIRLFVKLSRNQINQGLRKSNFYF